MTSRGSSNAATRGSAAATLAVNSADIATAAEAACVRFELSTDLKLTEANGVWEEFAPYTFVEFYLLHSLPSFAPRLHCPPRQWTWAGRLFMRIARFPYVVRKHWLSSRLKKGMTSFQ